MAVRACVLALGLVCTGCAIVTPAPATSGPALQGVPAVQVYAVGDIADCRQAPPERTDAARTAKLVPVGTMVLGLGDMAYKHADASTLAACFEPTWGRHRTNLFAIPGNHDYVRGRADDFLAYFDVSAQPQGFVAYAREIAPGWQLIALDSNARGAALQSQLDWLRRTLDERSDPAGQTASQCLLVMWHSPLFSSGWHRGSGTHMRASWEMLDGHGADLLLSGHEHFYEAFDPLDAEGTHVAHGQGIRQFTVGTGGAKLFGFWRPPYASRARVLSHGVLQLTLAADRYAWRFVDVDGRIRDAGEATCRRKAPD